MQNLTLQGPVTSSTVSFLILVSFTVSDFLGPSAVRIVCQFSKPNVFFLAAVWTVPPFTTRFPWLTGEHEIAAMTRKLEVSSILLGV